MESVLSIFKIGIGPSSSHTIGPIVASNRFCELIRADLPRIFRIKVILHGSLSLTGKGHLSDIASIIGLSGVEPQNLSPASKQEILHLAISGKKLYLCGEKMIDFDYETDLIFDDSMLPCHENGIIFEAFDAKGNVLNSQTYYSTGGGFVSTKEELESLKNQSQNPKKLKFDFHSARSLSKLCKTHKKSIPQIVMMRESELFGEKYVKDYCRKIYDAMMESYENGINSKEEILPGKIKLKRLAPSIKKRLDKAENTSHPLDMVDFISMYARAISEENASGGKVVTAPTNGACGVVPAVLLYAKNHIFDMSENDVFEFILTCSAIGYLYKKNASISGAEAGCQAEIGVASSMAAAGMAHLWKANIDQILSAAEIAMEHHLGLTCDPIAGLVQIPCIERNVLGAIKAISSVKLALEIGYNAKVGLDEVIATMYKTGKDLNPNYKETSLGGLVKMVSC